MIVTPMFTGLVEAVGVCEKLERNSQGGRLEIQASFPGEIVAEGDSVAVNGCCLTAVCPRGGVLSFDLLEETLRRTNLGGLSPGSIVNLERALAANARLGGHFVQGHVDDTTQLISRSESGPDLRLDFQLPSSLAPYVAFKGSVAINGVSLTVAEVAPTSFTIWIIPHTRSATNLGGLTAGDRVNVETDILAKYTESILRRRFEDSTLESTTVPVDI